MAQHTTVADRIIKAHSQVSSQKITFEAHATTGAVLDSAAFGSPVAGGILDHAILSHAKYVAGTTAPTATGDITLIDEDGFDILVGAGANIAGVNTWFAINKPIIGQLILKVSNTTVNSATGTFELIYNSIRIN